MSNLLVVDVGNTNIVLGVYRDDDLIGSWRLATHASGPPTRYGSHATAHRRLRRLARRRDRLFGRAAARAFAAMIHQLST